MTDEEIKLLVRLASLAACAQSSAGLPHETHINEAEDLAEKVMRRWVELGKSTAKRFWPCPGCRCLKCGHSAWAHKGYECQLCPWRSCTYQGPGDTEGTCDFCFNKE